MIVRYLRRAIAVELPNNLIDAWCRRDEVEGAVAAEREREAAEIEKLLREP